MLIDISNLRAFHERGTLVHGQWGDARKTACLMSALTGATDIEGCAAVGWPGWLAELGIVIFDYAPDEKRFARSVAFAEAVEVAQKRGADFDRVFRDIRITAILPIAMKAIGHGDEPWRVDCRAVVQWSIDHDGAVADPARAAGAAGAAWAAEAAGAARAAWAAAHKEIFEATIVALHGEAT